MAKNLVEFLTALSKKSGIKMDDEKVIAFLSTEGLDKIEVPDEIGVIDNKLITIIDAKNNHPEIKPHYTSQSLAPLDKIIESSIDEYGLDSETRASLIAIGSTYERAKALNKAIQASEGKKSVTDKEKFAAYQRQIDEFTNKFRNVEAEKENDKKRYDNELTSFKLTHEKKQLFNEYKTVYDELPVEVRQATFLNLLDKKLQDKGAEIVYDESGTLVLRKKDGTNYYGENNQQVNVKQLTEQVLSENKILKVTGTNQNQNGNNNNSTNGQNRTNPNGGNANNGNNSGSSFIKSFNEQAIKDAANSAASIG